MEIASTVNGAPISVDEIACGGNYEVWFTDDAGKLYHR